MSFLSSHRLHWGVHHELTDNFWLQIERMVRPGGENPAAETETAGSPPRAAEDPHEAKPSPDVLGP